MNMEPEIVFLKLGGSLITQKDQPHTAREDVIRRLASEIAQARIQRPELRILLGHGSGSFGHHAAAKYGTRAGVYSPQDWAGFVEVWQEARALNQVVIEILSQAGLPVIAFPPSSWLVARDGQAFQPEIRPISLALQHALIPVVQGDVALDLVRGGTILSTEDVFAGLAPLLTPHHILVAGVDEGVWADFPICTRLLVEVTPSSFDPASASLQGSAHTDVTGGMREKVQLMLHISQELPEINIRIFSGLQPGNLTRALLGESIGTRIHG